MALRFPRKIVIQSIRTVLESVRVKILAGQTADIALDAIPPCIEAEIKKLSSYSLLPLINATGIVLHTNLGRAVLSEKALENISVTGRGYSNVEYDLETGKRGKRHAHTKGLLRQITGAEDALIVNNKLLLCFALIQWQKQEVMSPGASSLRSGARSGSLM
jgi:L-seryl-tRNA(Ser) seleniumtransferase